MKKTVFAAVTVILSAACSSHPATDPQVADPDTGTHFETAVMMNPDGTIDSQRLIEFSGSTIKSVRYFDGQGKPIDSSQAHGDLRVQTSMVNYGSGYCSTGDDFWDIAGYYGNELCIFSTNVDGGPADGQACLNSGILVREIINGTIYTWDGAIRSFKLDTQGVTFGTGGCYTTCGYASHTSESSVPSCVQTAGWIRVYPN